MLGSGDSKRNNGLTDYKGSRKGETYTKIDQREASAHH